MLVYVYVASLVIGGVLLAASLLLGGHDAGVTHDADGGHDAGHSDPSTESSHGDIVGFLTLFLSLRFWTYFLAFFGLTGLVLDGLGIVSSRLLSLPLAIGVGAGLGFAAVAALRALGRDSSNSALTVDDYIGKPGTVTVPITKDAPGKIRMQLKGATIDLLARSADDDELAAKQLVLVVAIEDTVAVVTADTTNGYKRRLGAGSAPKGGSG